MTMAMIEFHEETSLASEINDRYKTVFMDIFENAHKRAVE